MNAFITWNKCIYYLNFVRDMGNSYMGFEDLGKMKHKKRKQKIRHKNYQSIFPLKFTCRRERGTEIKHKKAGKNLSNKGKVLFVFETDRFASAFWGIYKACLVKHLIYVISHLTLQNVNIGRQMSLFTLSRNKYYQKEKKMSPYQKKITWWCLQTYLCVC